MITAAECKEKTAINLQKKLENRLAQVQHGIMTQVAEGLYYFNWTEEHYSHVEFLETELKKAGFVVESEFVEDTAVYEMSAEWF